MTLKQHVTIAHVSEIAKIANFGISGGPEFPIFAISRIPDFGTPTCQFCNFAISKNPILDPV